MRIGELRDRVIVQSTAQTNASADTYGLTDTYATPTPATIWANVEQLYGEKRYLDLTQTYLISYRVTIRYNTDIKLTSRLLWDGRYLYINDISGDSVKGSMVLMCYEKASS